MQKLQRNAIGGVFLTALLSAPAWGASVGRPGTLNYVEGQAFIGTQTLDAKSVGSTELEPGQTLNTGVGKAELLLPQKNFVRAVVLEPAPKISGVTNKPGWTFRVKDQINGAASNSRRVGTVPLRRDLPFLLCVFISYRIARRRLPPANDPTSPPLSQSGMPQTLNFKL